jgi:sugar lactone lactonase YvrE
VSAATGSAIYKITPSGPSWIVSTLAGYSGSGGPAVDGTNGSARFNRPEGVAVDSAGSVYVGDYWNSTIRKITPAGVTTTLAGLGSAFGSADGAGSAARFAYPNGVAVDSHGTVYVADELNNTIRMGWPIVQMELPLSALSGQVQTQGFGFSVSLASGLTYRIQASSNLSTWSDLTNFSPAGLTFSFLDEGATNCPQRFYRVAGP